ncbi:MSHA pilin protein MshD [Marinobacter pelagius]|uniref:MSHA pilin protein MshD n=1 Tax=Marinobacter pelagius TaxID=379482 RepID=A0A366G0S1_9GAMM|nr:prepilin-type N-terminal cleavage/methylation domain-containing protein [Marinobacter pelagius]RBP20553.1 MSHA pilin protein MshD [Marinobacter pelagius]
MRQSGVTLVELIITIVVLGIAIAGVVGAFSVITGRSADPLNQTRAVTLSQLYMDEILSRYYDESTPLGGGKVAAADVDCGTGGPDGETRPTFDDTDDYDGLADGPPADSDGNALVGYGGFAVAVAVACAGTEVGVAAEDAKRIDITITDPSGQDWLFTAYRANF